MGLSGAQRQARWRAKREALVRGHPEVAERALLQAAERCGGLSAEERGSFGGCGDDLPAALAGACCAGAEGSHGAMRLTRRRKEAIVLAYVLATNGRLPTHLGELLAAMRERMGPVTEDEVRRAIRWALRRKLGAAKTMSGADRSVSG